jgi:MFS family permease
VEAAGVRPAAARRDLWLLTTGIGVTTAGDALALVALLLRLRPEGTGWLAALLAAQLVPLVLLAPVVGHLVDRFETRRVLLIAVCGQAVVAVPLAFATAPALTVALFLVLAMFNAAVRPATNALVPAIVGEDRSTQGYSRVALGQNIGFIAGPALGGVLTGAFGAKTALLVDAGTFVVLAGLCFLLRARREPAIDAEEHLSRREQARAGFDVLWQDHVLRVVIAVCGVSIASSVVDNVAAPFRFIDQLGTTPTGYGVYLTLWGVGALAGSQVPPRIPAASERYLPAVGNVLCGLGIAGIGAAPTVAVAFLASAAGGLGNGMANVSQNALIGKRVPEAQRGRAFAANSAVMQSAIGIGTAAAGPLVAWLAADVAMMVCGLLGALAAAIGVGALAFGRAARAPVTS